MSVAVAVPFAPAGLTRRQRIFVLLDAALDASAEAHMHVDAADQEAADAIRLWALANGVDHELNVYVRTTEHEGRMVRRLHLDRVERVGARVQPIATLWWRSTGGAV